MPKQVIPIRQIEGRLNVVGRLRIGDKTDRGAPIGRTGWRFTSSDLDALSTVAELYDATVEPFPEPKSSHTHQVRTDYPQIDVALPPDPLTLSYEQWSGKGRLLRCDGESAWIPKETRGPDGPEMIEVEQPCLCMAKGERACDPAIKLDVLLPNVQASLWQLRSKSENAMHELPAAVKLIQMSGAIGLTHATLRIDWRQGQGRRYPVPVLGSSHTPVEIAAGANRLGVADVRPVESDPSTRAIEPTTVEVRPRSAQDVSHFRPEPAEVIDIDDENPGRFIGDQGPPPKVKVKAEVMPVCDICGESIVGPSITDENGAVFHAQPADCAGAS